MRLRALVLALMCGAGAAGAQSQLDPADRLYRWLGIWEGRGLVQHLPALRPYPVSLVADLLAQVQERGTEKDARVARELADSVGPGGLHVRLGERAATRDSSFASETGLGVTGSLPLPDPFSLSARFTFWAVANDPSRVQPLGERDAVDIISSGSGAVIPIPGVDLSIRQDLLAAGSWYRDGLALEVGLTRASFGPFFDNGVVLGPQAPVSGNALATWDLGKISVEMAFFALVQSTPTGHQSSDKFLVLQGLEVDPFPWLTIGVFESVVWAGRFEPFYLIPAFELYYVQSLTGFADNSFAGLTAVARLPAGLRLKGLFYADDIHFTDILSGQFDTKWKLAAEAGLQWTPSRGLLSQVSLDYTAVMPYTYTHYGDLLNYTNYGQNLGPALEPNSQRLELRAFSAPLRNLELDFVSRFIQHGNASEGIPGIDPPADGTIWDAGYDGLEATFQPPFVLPPGMHYHRFLTQSVLDTALQAGLGVTWLPNGGARARWGTLSLSARYLFEYRWNENLVAGSNNAHNYFSFSTTWTY